MRPVGSLGDFESVGRQEGDHRHRGLRDVFPLFCWLAVGLFTVRGSVVGVACARPRTDRMRHEFPHRLVVVDWP